MTLSIGAKGTPVSRSVNSGSAQGAPLHVLKMTPEVQAIIAAKMKPLEELEYHQNRLEELQRESKAHYEAAKVHGEKAKVHGEKADQLAKEVAGHKANITQAKNEIEEDLAIISQVELDAAKARAEKERLRLELAALDDSDDDDTDGDDVQHSPEVRTGTLANQLFLEGSRK